MLTSGNMIAPVLVILPSCGRNAATCVTLCPYLSVYLTIGAYPCPMRYTFASDSRSGWFTRRLSVFASLPPVPTVYETSAEYCTGCPSARYDAWKLLSVMQNGSRSLALTRAPRLRSSSCETVLQKPLSLPATSRRPPCQPNHDPYATPIRSASSAKWKSRLPVSLRYPFSADTVTEPSGCRRTTVRYRRERNRTRRCSPASSGVPASRKPEAFAGSR